MQNRENNTTKYVIGILIALGFYIISTVLGSIINVLISFAAGYSKWSSFMESENVAGLILMLFFSLANHIFMSWITTNVMLKYAQKNSCVTQWYFRSAAISIVVFALLIVPILFSKTGGWLSYISHALGITLFGRAKYKKYQQSFSKAQTSGIVAGQTGWDGVQPRKTPHNSETYIPSISAQPSKEKIVNTAKPALLYCHKCGTKLTGNGKFCHKCGAKIPRDY